MASGATLLERSHHGDVTQLLELAVKSLEAWGVYSVIITQ
jgi:hypothetical protein